MKCSNCGKDINDLVYKHQRKYCKDHYDEIYTNNPKRKKKVSLYYKKRWQEKKKLKELRGIDIE